MRMYLFKICISTLHARNDTQSLFKMPYIQISRYRLLSKLGSNKYVQRKLGLINEQRLKKRATLERRNVVTSYFFFVFFFFFLTFSFPALVSFSLLSLLLIHLFNPSIELIIYNICEYRGKNRD